MLRLRALGIGKHAKDPFTITIHHPKLPSWTALHKLFSALFIGTDAQGRCPASEDPMAHLFSIVAGWADCRLSWNLLQLAIDAKY
jgi:hypothetical protein